MLLAAGCSITLAVWIPRAFAQTRPAFEVATVKPAIPVDQAQEMAAGQVSRQGPHYAAGRAEYIDMRLKDLILIAWSVKSDQIVGPAWLATQRFDIVAKLPDGTSGSDAPAMLRTLLEDRFGLILHHAGAQRSVLGLVVGKEGPKLTASSGVPHAIDQRAPLNPGEVQMEGPGGLIRVTNTRASSVMNMGANGIARLSANMTTQTQHLECSMITMAGFAGMLMKLPGGSTQMPIVDMTEIKGYYDVTLDVAPDTSGNSSINTALSTLGLKLEPRKTTVDQLVIDRINANPTEN
jgi:uncharacterized protein (TIGR03435 family)